MVVRYALGKFHHQGRNKDEIKKSFHKEKKFKVFNTYQDALIASREFSRGEAQKNSFKEIRNLPIYAVKVKEKLLRSSPEEACVFPIYRHLKDSEAETHECIEYYIIPRAKLSLMAAEYKNQQYDFSPQSFLACFHLFKRKDLNPFSKKAKSKEGFYHKDEHSSVDPPLEFLSSSLS